MMQPCQPPTSRPSTLVRRWQHSAAPILRTLSRLGNRLLPTRCLLCGCTLHGDLLCADCDLALPHLAQPQHSHGDSVCPQCALPFSSDAHLCGQCLYDPPPFDAAAIPYRYQHPLDYLIHGFKYRRQRVFGRCLAERLSAHLQDHYQHSALPWPELIISVPLHWTRRLQRGFNQTELLGQHLSRALGIPLHTRLCRRREHTPSQRGLSRQQRQRNLRHAFALTARARPLLQGRCVALLDDVVTTTSTARALSQLLLDGGATEVHLWALARTPDTRTGQTPEEKLQ